MKEMFSKELENLIKVTLADGVLTDKEKSVLIKRAQKEGVDIDELEVYINYILQQSKEKEEQKAIEEESKSKVGKVMKCANCGGEYAYGSPVCEHCGFIFDMSIISHAYENFNKQLQKKIASIHNSPLGSISGQWIRDLTDIANFIKNHQVPSNRLDLLSYLINLQPLVNKKGRKNPAYISNGDFGYFYWLLFQNCIHKAKLFYADDKYFKESFDFYEKELNRGKTLPIIILIVLFLIICAVGVMWLL